MALDIGDCHVLLVTGDFAGVGESWKENNNKKRIFLWYFNKMYSKINGRMWDILYKLIVKMKKVDFWKGKIENLKITG